MTPEYNHGVNGATKNAIDYLVHEWAHKPAGLVSYGGVSGGTRAVHALKPTLSYLKMMPLTEGVTIPFVAKFLDGDGENRRFTPARRSRRAQRRCSPHWPGPLRSCASCAAADRSR